MTKTMVMLIGLAGVLGAGTACYSMFGERPRPDADQVAACAGLEGQAKLDCERRQGH